LQLRGASRLWWDQLRFQLYAVVTLLLTARAIAQTGALTLDECVRRALEAPSAVTIAQQERRIADLGANAARSSFLPQLQFNNGFTYNSPARTPSLDSFTTAGGGAGSFVALNGVHEYQSLVGTAWEIDTSGRLRAALARSRADQQITAADLLIIQRDLKRSVAGAFFRVLLARHLISANRDALQEAESFTDRVRAMFRAGEVAQADVAKAESQVAFLAQTLRASELDAQVANADLASFWTIDVSTELQLADTLESPVPPEPVEQQSTPFLARPEFRLFDAQRSGFEADYRRQRSFLFPQLTFNLEYGIDSNRVSIRDRGQAAFFNLNIPVFDWFRNHDLAQQFKLQAQQVETKRQVSTREFSRDYQASLARVRIIFEQIGLTQAQVRSSEENLKLSRIRYEGGEGPALDVVAAQTQLALARSNYFTALANYAVARVELEVASAK
jgi:outer membrane protein